MRKVRLLCEFSFTVLLFTSNMCFGEDYSLDGTAEPDTIPNLSKSAVDAPARIIGSPRPEEDKSLVRDGDEPLYPPALVKMPNGELGTSREYRLVQYEQQRNPQRKSSSRKVADAKNPQSDALSDSAAAVPDWNVLTDAQKIEKLRVSIATTLEANTRRGQNLQNNTPYDVLLLALPYGADARIWQPNLNANSRDKNEPNGQAVYSIGALCWNYPCAGKTMLRSTGSRIYAKTGAGYQQRLGEMLAVMAMSNIMPDYEMKVAGGAFSIADLIESEKLSVSAGQNQALVLVGLSFYGKTNEKWRNDLGEMWDIEKLATEELNRSIDQGSSDVTDWLLGLTAAVKLYENERKPVRGALALAKKQIKTYQDFVLSVQNDQYLWHPKFFLYKGTNPDAYETLYASGHILRWLLLSVTDKELRNPDIVRSVASLTSIVNRIPSSATANLLTDRQLEALTVSLQALSVYQQRAFSGEPAEKTSEKKVAIK